jgi:hypothetical protein
MSFRLCGRRSGSSRTRRAHDQDLARDLARLGRGKFRLLRTHRDVAPALSEFFSS